MIHRGWRSSYPANPGQTESTPVANQQGADHDGQLMERYRDGDETCFAILLRRHQGAVFRFFLHHVGDMQSAEDLTQETFLRVVHHRASFRTGARFTTWVYTIAHRLAVDEMRRRRYRRHRSLEEPVGGRDDESSRTLGDLVGDPREQTETRAAHLEMRAALEAAIRQLPEEQREVFTLREMGGLSFQEIAQVLGCNENTVKSRMRYALERLHTALRDLVVESEG